LWKKGIWDRKKVELVLWERNDETGADLNEPALKNKSPRVTRQSATNLWEGNKRLY